MKFLVHVTVILFISINIPLYAANNRVTLTFFIGNVTLLKDGKAAAPVYAGKQLGSNDIIKTGKNSYAEVNINGAFAYIGENKSLHIRNLNTKVLSSPLLNAMKKTSSSSVKSKLLTVAAVRAEEKDEEVIWADENASSKADPVNSITDSYYVLERMAEMVTENRFTAARDYYKKITLSGANKSRFDFMGGIACYNLCYYGEAAGIFRGLADNDSDPGIKNESAFFAGLSLNAVLNYSESIPYLTAYISAQPEGNYAAQALFLRGVSYLNTGQKEEGKKDLNMVIHRFSSDPVAGDVERYLKEIK